MATIFGKPTPPSNDGGVATSRELGFDLLSDVNPSLTGVWYYRLAGAPATCKAIVYQRPALTVLNSTDSGALVDGWNLITLSSAVPLAAGVTYTACVFLGPCVIGYDGSGLTSDVVSADTHMRAVAGTGRFGNNLAVPTYPDQSWSGSWGIDVEYTLGVTHELTASSTQGGMTAAGALTRDRSLVGASAQSGVTVRGALTVVSRSAPTRQSGGWYSLLGTLRRNEAEVARWRESPPGACPNDGEPLRAYNGVLHCPAGDYEYPRDGRR